VDVSYDKLLVAGRCCQDSCIILPLAASKLDLFRENGISSQPIDALKRSDCILIILNECCYEDLYESKTWFNGARSRFHECISCTDNQISSLYTSLLPSSPSSSSFSSPPLLSSSDSAAIMPRSSICPFASSQICIFQSLSPARF
jgi:hypothetical protein